MKLFFLDALRRSVMYIISNDTIKGCHAADVFIDVVVEILHWASIVVVQVE